ncbi:MULTISPECIES: hypothetical protein [unclassified Caballeronia]|uniref:hypothetical protein n=1 Tax=unclassified Caballeronia TaxID=2646786 RepID=UPI002861BCA5|nr:MULTISPECIES: hypothetical protein [unclassified Caballeronia]MDR5775589.1 hypothetical protein [Caballeronia sp. LZ002]MDR5802316.1 hypothetical protein [Caballeronia sp. LZ001]MDR5851027.1 hypothetical protein [Caballeronia sp. LZ003]
MSSGFTTQAQNFGSAVSGGVDPRTGLFNVQLVVGELTGNHNQGPCFKATLGYSPLQRHNLGYGIGFSLGYSHFDSDGGVLVLSNGEQYRVAGKEDPVILQKHTDHFRFDCVVLGGKRFYRIRWKDGSVEILAGPDVGDVLKMPLHTFTPAGHGLTWTWSSVEVNQSPRLEAITDDTGASLMEVAYKNNVSSTLTLWPRTPDQFEVVLSFTNNYLTEILRADLRTILGYDAVGSSADSETMSYLNRIEHSTGLVEEVTYLSEAMHFPQGAQLTALPAVVKHTLMPGAGQPDINREFAYSENNYLAGGSGGDWSSELDALYGVASEYEYWSQEKLMVDGEEHTATTRTYNHFHLQTREEIRSGHCVTLHDTKYNVRLGQPLEQQPKTFLLPMQQIVTWRDESNPLEEQSRSETITSTFDDAGNPLTHVRPDGTRTEYTYYPAGGEKDQNGEELCPGEPNGFVRLLKSVTVHAPVVMANAGKLPLSVPVTQTRYTYCSHRTRKGAPLTSVVLQSSEQHLVDGQLIRKIEREYVDDPSKDEHCRLKNEAVALYHYSAEGQHVYETRRTFDFAVRPHDQHVLAQTVTSVAHDGLQICEKRIQSLQSGRLLEKEDHQGLRTTYVYDALGRLVCETRNAGTTYELVTRYAHEKTDEGLFTTHEDALGNKTKSRFDGLGRVVQSWQWDIDGPSRRWVEIGKCGYDAAGRLAMREAYDWTVHDADRPGINLTERFAYDQWGQAETVKTGDGLRHVRQYDPVTRTQTVYVQGTDGTQTAIHETVYDVHGRPRQECLYLVDGAARTLYSERQHMHDAWGRLRQDVDELGQMTLYEYDAHSRVSRIKLADGTVVFKNYGSFSEQTLVREIGVEIGEPPDVRRITLGEQTFDGLGRVTHSQCGPRSWFYEYMNPGAATPSKVTAPDGVTLEYTYIPELDNAVSRVRAKRERWHILSPGIEQNFKHDRRSGAVTEAQATPNPVLTRLEYHPSGRLKGEAQTGVDGRTRSTVHDFSSGGKLMHWTDVAGAQQKYDYDEHGRLITIADPAVRVNLSYDVFGRIERWVATDLSSTQCHTLTTILRLDALGREIERTISSSRGQTWAIAQTWKANHQVRTRTWSIGGQTRRKDAYEYDARNRLVTYTCSGADVPMNEFGKRVTRQTFAFDALDNITQCVSEFEGGANIATFDYDKKDPCLLVGVANTHDGWPRRLRFEYDDAGRMLLNECGQELSYDELGRLVSTESGEQKSEYGYDAWDRLVSQKTGDETEMLYYRAEKLVNRIPDAAAEQQRLVRLGSVTLAQVSEGAQQTTWLTGTSDGHEVVAAFNGTEHVEYVYGPYGEKK